MKNQNNKKMPAIQLGKKAVSLAGPSYIIAEIGSNHDRKYKKPELTRSSFKHLKQRPYIHDLHRYFPIKRKSLLISLNGLKCPGNGTRI